MASLATGQAVSLGVRPFRKRRAALVNGISGKLSYRDPPPPMSAQQQIQQQMQQLQQERQQKAQQLQPLLQQLRQVQQQAQNKQPPQQAQQVAQLQQQVAQLQQEITAQAQKLQELQQLQVQQAEQQRAQAVIKRGGVQAIPVQQLQLQGIQIQGAGQAFVVGGGNLVINGAQVEPGLAQAAQPAITAGMALFLRNGDTYPVDSITHIDEHGVSFTTKFSRRPATPPSSPTTRSKL